MIPFAVQLIPGGIFALGIPFFIKESPRWLVTRGRREEAIKNLCIIRGLSADDAYLIEEINAIDIQVEHDRTAVGEGFWAPFRQVFTQWHLLKRLLICTSLFMWQNGTGINAINCTSRSLCPLAFSVGQVRLGADFASCLADYSPTIFKSIGIIGTNTSLFTTGIFGVIKTVGALVWCFLIIDHFGRRGILLVGSVGGAIGMFVIAGELPKIASCFTNRI